MDLMKGIPGYKAILKSVIQLQIKQLVDLLEDQTGDDCIILVASVPEKTICHLGTSNAEDFLQEQDQMKTEFLHHCVKKHDENTEENSDTGLINQSNEAGEISEDVTKERLTAGLKMLSPRRDRRPAPYRREPFVTDENKHRKTTWTTHESHGEQNASFMIQDNAAADVIYSDNDDDVSQEYTRHETDPSNKPKDKSPFQMKVVCLDPSRFTKGKKIEDDMRMAIIHEVIANGGNPETGYVPRGVYTRVKNKLGLPAVSSITRRWEQFVNEGRKKDNEDENMEDNENNADKDSEHQATEDNQDKKIKDNEDKEMNYDQSGEYK